MSLIETIDFDNVKEAPGLGGQEAGEFAFGIGEVLNAGPRSSDVRLQAWGPP
jgi:hypothetical protein